MRLTDEQRLDRQMTEAKLNSRVMYRARKHGIPRVLRLQRATVGGSWRTPAVKGYPDLTIFGSRIIYRELKRELGKLDEDQIFWRDLLLAVGADWGVWRPSDLREGRVEAELKAIAFSLTAAPAKDYIDHQDDDRAP